MDIVIDISALIAVIVGEPEREKIVDITRGNTLIGPGSIPWEIGNAFSAMFKRNRLSIAEAQKGLKIFNTIPIRYIEPSDFRLSFCTCLIRNRIFDTIMIMVVVHILPVFIQYFIP
jgi:predicted nucleic acid-binding protein